MAGKTVIADVPLDNGRSRRVIEVNLDKGEGRQGLLGRVDAALVLDNFRPKPGVYLVTIERVGSKEKP